MTRFVISFASLYPSYKGRCTKIAFILFISLHSISASYYMRLHTHSPHELEIFTGMLCSTIALYNCFISVFVNSATGVSVFIGSSSGMNPSLSAFLASIMFMAIRSNLTLSLLPACPSIISRSGLCLVTAVLNVLATDLKLTGISSSAMSMPKVFWVATLLATTHDEFSSLLPNGSKPVMSLFTLLGQYYILSCNIPFWEQWPQLPPTDSWCIAYARFQSQDILSLFPSWVCVHCMTGCQR